MQTPLPARPFGTYRDPALILILSYLTCGIYYLIWMVGVSREVDALLGEQDTDPVLEAVLTFFTCGFYSIYWDYKLNRKIQRLQEWAGVRPVDNTALYLVLDFVGFGMVNALIQQGLLNEVWRTR